MRLAQRKYRLAFLHAGVRRGVDRLAPEMRELDQRHVIGRLDGDDLSRIEPAVGSMRRNGEAVLDGDMSGGQYIPVIVDDEPTAGCHLKTWVVLPGFSLAPCFGDGERYITGARRSEQSGHFRSR